MLSNTKKQMQTKSKPWPKISDNTQHNIRNINQTKERHLLLNDSNKALMPYYVATNDQCAR